MALNFAYMGSMKLTLRKDQQYSGCCSGGSLFGVVVLLVMVIVIVGLYFMSKPAVKEEQQKSGKPAPADSEQVAQGKFKIIEEKKQDVPQKEVVAKPEPKVVVPEPVKEKPKSEVDILLEKHFPEPSFKPLEEIVSNWKNIPKRAMPDRVLVQVGASYTGGEGIEDRLETKEHYAMPLQAVDGVVTVGHLSDPRLRAQVELERTNLKQLVGDLYEKKKSEAVAKVRATRERNRAKAVAFLQKKKEQAAEGSGSSDANEGLASLDDDTVDAGDFSMKRYGRKFRGDYWPSPKNGKNSKHDHETPMGPICGVMSVLYEKREAKIISLWDKGPGARAGLDVGDVITKVDGKMLHEYGRRAAAGGKGAPEQLGMAMIDAQASERPVVLTVKRDGDTVEIPIDLPAAPPFADGFPKGCVRSQSLSKAAAEYLLEQQDGGSGKWRANDYTNAWCGLALLATGEKKYASEIKKLARATAKKYDLGASPSEQDLIEGDDGKGAASNWFVCINGIFLAEYFLATEDKMVLDALEHCCRSMDIRIHTENGRFGHSRDRNHIPYGGKGLVIINVHAHLMWALEAMIDGESTYDWTTWDISYKKAVVPSFGSSGGIGYNFSARGGDQSTPRTGAMLTALAMVGKNKSDQRQLADWLSDNHQVFPNVHAMTFIGPIYGFMGLKNSNMRDYRKAMDDYQWMFSLMQPVNYDHGSYYFSDRGNSGGDEYCKKRLVGNVMALMVLNSHRDDTLWMLGNRKQKWYK